MDVELSKRNKEILGYKLIAKIGSGGFGEVWSAEAPGGLKKAIKLVHGYHNEEKAQSELKSLDRIKSIRHPFLLSLERIEVVEGQLVIVSELADGCLTDVFRRYIEDGFDGIDREKLISYLKDAADALDYLSANHSLQHLDIKPENLLIFGDHVKIADFGLLKDVNDCNQSLVTGMTPAYAAPEVFDGRPSSKSDQYALAIVFQEMLTGTRPFDGTTSAQLAGQHLYGKPKLVSLPKSDKTIILKALNRDPLHRFSSCSEFISNLAQRKLRKKVPTKMRLTQQNVTGSNATEVLNPDTIEQTALVPNSQLPWGEEEIKKLPPPEIKKDGQWLQPVLVVSIGRLAGSIANNFNAKLTERYGETKNRPSIQTLCIDSDQSAIDELVSSEHKTFMGNQDVVSTPLKNSEFYRSQPSESLSWINRRWIYNIPRSRQTEGIRPLGRLAFADHFETICNSLRNKILEITAAENLATTSETFEANIGSETTPRVVVVGSIGGGIGGMLLDVGYLIRTLFSEEGLNTPDMTAILTHSVNSRQQNAELSTANAIATLAELRHYVDFGYPGDAALGIPEFEEPPFDSVYFNELENDLRQTELNQRHSDIAEWIIGSNAASTVPFFEGCRDASKDSNNFELRTFGIKSCGPCEGNGIFEKSNQLIVDLLNRWQVGTPDSPRQVSEEGLQSLADQTIGLNELFEQFHKQLVNEISPQFHDSLLLESKELLSVPDDIETGLVQLHEKVLGVPKSEREVGYECTSLEKRFESIIEEKSTQDVDRLAIYLSNSYPGESFNLNRVSEQLNQLAEKQESVADEIEATISKCLSDTQLLMDRLRQIIPSNKRKKVARIADGILREYQELQFKAFLLRHCNSYSNAKMALIKKFEATVDISRKQLLGIQERFTEPFNIAPQDGQFSLANFANDYLANFNSVNLEELDKRLFAQTIKTAGGYLSAFENIRIVQRVLPHDLELISAELVAKTLSRISIDKLIVEKQLPPEQAIQILTDQLNQALPRLKNCGGAMRLLISTPRHGGPSFIHNVAAKHMGTEATSLCGSHGDLIFCFEAEGVPLTAVVKHLTKANPRALELSRKIHCRNDVQWSKLDDLF